MPSPFFLCGGAAFMANPGTQSRRAKVLNPEGVM